MKKNQHVSIFGIPVSKLGMKDTVLALKDAIYLGKPNHIITANPIMIMAALQNPTYKAMMQRAEWVVPDGTGLVWAASHIGNPVAERVPGIDLLHQLLQTGEQYNWRVFMLGSSPEIIQEASLRLQQQYPNVHIVGVKDGFFTADQDEEVVELIRQAKPHIVFVGRSADTQEPWIDKYKTTMDVPLIMGVGGSFDVIAGKVKRAPRLFQKLHLEWFYRLLKQPWRYKRMLALPKFAWKVIKEKERVQM